jgi:hypothetical protein
VTIRSRAYGRRADTAAATSSRSPRITVVEQITEADVAIMLGTGDANGDSASTGATPKKA